MTKNYEFFSKKIKDILRKTRLFEAKNTQGPNRRIIRIFFQARRIKFSIAFQVHVGQIFWIFNVPSKNFQAKC